MYAPRAGSVPSFMSATAIPAVTQSGEPILVLKEGRRQFKGREAMENNISAARLLCEILCTSLGPHGMDKLIVEPEYEGSRITVTNDGAFMLKKMLIQHPAAKILVDVSKATDSSVGDGTTSAVVFTGALLERADELLEKGLHPIIIAAGYQKAASRANQILESIAERIDPRDRISLERVARTSMQSKIIGRNSAKIASLVVDAALGVATEQENGKFVVDVKNIKVEKKKGGSIEDTELILGVVLDQKIAYSGMPKRIENARIALVNMPFEIEETQFNSMITITEATQVTRFLDQQNAMFSEKVEKLKSVGANVLICQKDIDDMALHYLSMSGIMAVKKSLEFETQNIVRATGARMVSHLDDLTEEDLGYAGVIEERQIDTDKMLFISMAKNPKSVTILVRGANKFVADEAARSIHDAIMVIKDVMEEPCVVVGGGAVEAEVTYQLMGWANQLEGREQMAALKYAEALEQIPTILAQNAGLNPINTIAELRAKHSEGGEGARYGIPASGKKVRDLYAEAVFEPLIVKKQVLKSATEAVCMLIRIDNVVLISPPKQQEPREKELNEFKKEGLYPGPPPSDLATLT